MLRALLPLAAVLALCAPAVALAAATPSYPDAERTQDARLTALVAQGVELSADEGWPADGLTAAQYCPDGIALWLATIPADRAAEASPCTITFARVWLNYVRTAPDPGWECAVAAHEARHALGMMWHTTGLMTAGVIQRVDFPAYCAASPPPVAVVATPTPTPVVRQVTICDQFADDPGVRCYSP